MGTCNTNTTENTHIHTITILADNKHTHMLAGVFARDLTSQSNNEFAVTDTLSVFIPVSGDWRYYCGANMVIFICDNDSDIIKALYTMCLVVGVCVSTKYTIITTHKHPPLVLPDNTRHVDVSGDGTISAVIHQLVYGDV